MKIAIVDDEQSEIEKLTKLIGKYSFENNVEITCMTFTKGEVFLKEVLADGFDVTFLDIFLKDENGIDVAKKMRYAGDDSIIIFSTATDQYAVKSYRVRAFDYLVKPYDYDRIVETLALCQKAIVCDDKYFIVKSKRQDMKIKCKDVVYVDYYNHYVQIHTKKGIISTYSNFDDFYKNLAGQER
ncbi:MAG: LytTR family DNA-binding domain-containing protein, partial [Oscillospiraceae bacterium]